MLLAHDPKGYTVRAEPGGRAVCPGCRATLIPKCGPMVTWHWAHLGNDCDPWCEPETAWHAETKQALGDEIEFPVSRGTWTDDGIHVVERHRCDAVLVKGGHRRFIEVQHSAISWDTLRAREHFYSDLFWVFDCQVPFDEGRLSFTRNDHGTELWSWKHPRRSVLAASRQSYWYLGPDQPWYCPHKARPGQYAGVWGFGAWLEDLGEVRRHILGAPGWRVAWASSQGPDEYVPLFDPTTPLGGA